MEGEEEEFTLRWEDESSMKKESVIIEDTDQIAAENLMFLSQDVVNYAEHEDLECVTEEVITDDWTGGQDRVEVPIEQFANQAPDFKNEDDIDVPLPTDQDEYTAMRPWPCDFCSRRFRKKAALMNHMVAHQNDRPHGCNLCGVRYVRKVDLMNHLKTHAFVPEHPDDVDYEDLIDDSQTARPKKKRGRRRKERKQSSNGMWEHMTSARTQQWQRRARSPKPLPSPSPSLSPSPSPESPPPLPSDPSRPFVCKHCGVGFAREKALQSHSRIHGGDSPVECRACGELCWSRDALASHTRNKHPNLPQAAPAQEFTDSDNSDGDMDYQLSPTQEDSPQRVYEPVYDGNSKGPELFCQDCGVAFQRADLLRRHVAAAHSYKRHDSSSSTWGEHTCEVCGETCADALQLLAHAELHTERPRASTNNRIKKTPRGRGNSISSSSSRQFPCRECGKVFGSRSSQQIHVRIHTGERPYACRFCWKAFADGGTLRKHERIHTGEKPYACAVCPRAFNQRVVLREHIRSHHSAPDRRTNGTPMYACVVCGRQLTSSSELVQHLIQHSDANTAMKRQPQGGPRKYKRRRKMKSESVSDTADTDPPVQEETPLPPSPSPVPEPVAIISRRRRPQRVPPPRPKMIHTEDPRKARQQALRSRPPRHPADDLRAIQSQPVKREPTPSPVKTEVQPEIAQIEPDTGGPYKCEMCWEQFDRRDDLLLHVPIHI